MPNATVCFKKADGLEREELAGLDEVVYVRADGDLACSLNLTASVVLDLCDGSHSQEDIVEILCDSLPASREQVRKDVAALLEKLAEFGLIHKIQPA